MVRGGNFVATGGDSSALKKLVAIRWQFFVFLPPELEPDEGLIFYKSLIYNDLPINRGTVIHLVFSFGT